MKKKRRTFEIFSLSFLDVVSCGFGAIILLLVLIKVFEPSVREEMTNTTENVIQVLQQEIAQTRKEFKDVDEQIEEVQTELESEKKQLKDLQKELERLKASRTAAGQKETVNQVIEKELYSARQQLTEEMIRLQQQARPISSSDSVIGGVPVDSEYIIFVIDTSGSMKSYAWHLVRRKMQEILAIYPQVKGLQVMNDMGDYMYSRYRGKWIRDTPARRKSILKLLANWNAFSNSSPVEGIAAAIQQYYAPDKKISIYIFGDDFSRGSIQEVVDSVAQINRTYRNENSDGRVRIHAVGFPVLLTQPGAEVNVARFAALMRRLAEDNNGSFVGISSLR